MAISETKGQGWSPPKYATVCSLLRGVIVSEMNVDSTSSSCMHYSGCEQTTWPPKGAFRSLLLLLLLLLVVEYHQTREDRHHHPALYFHDVLRKSVDARALATRHRDGVVGVTQFLLQYKRNTMQHDLGSVYRLAASNLTDKPTQLLFCRSVTDA